MPKQHNIRWRDSDIKKIRKTIKNYNARITRAAKNFPEYGENLPEKASVKAARNTIKTRADFNNLINQLENWHFVRPDDGTFTMSRLERARLQTARKNAAAKVRRIVGKSPDDAAAMPKIPTMKQLSKNITDLDSYQSEVKRLKAFSKKGSEQIMRNDKGIAITKWEWEDRLERHRKAFEKDVADYEEIADLPQTIRGKPIGSTIRENKTIKKDEQEYYPPKFENMTKTSFAKMDKYMEARLNPATSEAQKRRYIENYIKALVRMGASDELINTFRSVPTDVIIRLLKTDAAGTIDFIYDLVELNAKLQGLTELWGEYAGDKIIHEIDLGSVKQTVAEEAARGYYGRSYTPYKLHPYNIKGEVVNRRRIIPKDLADRFNIKEEE